MMWGLIITQVQFVPIAVEAMVFELPKKISVSLLADWTESEPWTAFLVPSVPNLALIDSGFCCYAT